MIKKAILLAGGSGTRLYPITANVSKQLLPVYDKPVIYYSLSVLMMAGIREILIISSPRDLPLIEQHFADGSQFGLKLHYKVQPEPKGIAQAFIIGEEFIDNDPVCLMLGDNILFSQNLHSMLQDFVKVDNGAKILACRVNNPQAYGIVEFDDQQRVISIEEKPANPKSEWAVPGLYAYDNEVVNIAKNLKPSARGELEITDVNKEYLKRGQLQVCPLGRGVAWLDVGSFENLLSASTFIETIETRQNFKVACLEELSYRMGFLDKETILKNLNQYPENPYKHYIQKALQS